MLSSVLRMRWQRGLMMVVFDLELQELLNPIYKLVCLRELEIAYHMKLTRYDSLCSLVGLVPPTDAAAPNLEKFVLRIYERIRGFAQGRSGNDITKVRRVDNGTGAILEHLKVLEVAGSSGLKYEDEFISCVIESAVSLETVIINTSYQTTYPWKATYYGTWREEQEAEDHVRRHAKLWLEGIIPHTAQLIIHSR